MIDRQRRAHLERRIAATTYRMLSWGRHRVAPGLRSVIGVALMAGGVLGFLPVLGFWMLPLGVAFIALDVPRASHRIDRWMHYLAKQAQLLPPEPLLPPEGDQSTSSQ